jgi:hypothetical protein
VVKDEPGQRQGWGPRVTAPDRWPARPSSGCLAVRRSSHVADRPGSGRRFRVSTCGPAQLRAAQMSTVSPVMLAMVLFSVKTTRPRW